MRLFVIYLVSAPVAILASMALLISTGRAVDGTVLPHMLFVLLSAALVIVAGRMREPRVRDWIAAPVFGFALVACVLAGAVLYPRLPVLGGALLQLSALGWWSGGPDAAGDIMLVIMGFLSMLLAIAGHLLGVGLAHLVPGSRRPGRAMQ